ncbi:MAG: hypothetical protein M3Q56_07935 [Bacteroidota bacterium]|nr:hypothetical protein [Bacteroidota bacterium]
MENIPHDSFIPEPEELLPENMESAWIQNIKLRVEELLDKDPGLLFSHLYRLDVEESKLQYILKNVSTEKLSEVLAEEIWKRQKERLKVKLENKVDPIEGWEY